MYLYNYNNVTNMAIYQHTVNNHNLYKIKTKYKRSDE